MGSSVKIDALVELIEGSGLKYKKNSVSWIFTCPRCEKREKLYIRRRDGRFICFHCAESGGYRGRPEFALADLLDVPVPVVQSKLYDTLAPQGTVYLDIQLRDFLDEDELPPEKIALQAVCLPPDFYPIEHPFSKRGVEYLESRGLPLEIAQEYGLMYCPPKQRVVFPVAEGGKIFGWQLRTIGKHEIYDEETGETFRVPKVTTMVGLRKDQTVMFADRLRGSDQAILCEGPLDAIKAHKCGGGNIATMGKMVSSAQVALLRNAGIKKLYLALDPDATREAAKLAKEFRDLEMYLMHPPAGRKDLGEMTVDEVYEVYRNAPRITSEYLFVYLKPQS